METLKRIRNDNSFNLFYDVCSAGEEENRHVLVYSLYRFMFLKHKTENLKFSVAQVYGYSHIRKILEWRQNAHGQNITKMN